MINYHNIESRKLAPHHDYYVGYGGGHVWRIWRGYRKEWIASSNTATMTIRGRVLSEISAKLACL